MVTIKKGLHRNLFICIMAAMITHFAVLFSFSQEQQLKLKQIIDTINPNLNYAVCFIHPDQKEPEFARHAHKLLTPASNTKLFTAVAAWQTFGKDYCFETNIYTDGHQEGNVLFGSVYLKAAGDPSFTSEDLKKLIAQLKSKGIEIIKGDFCLDITQFFDDQSEYFGRGYCVDDLGETWNAPLTSLIINKNCIQLPDGTQRALIDPHHYALWAIKELLSEFEITCSGQLIKMATPKKNLAIVAHHTSEPLQSLIAHMLKVSDNLYANALFKLLGAHMTNEPGSWESGERALKIFLREVIGIDPDSLNIVDGSGLSRYTLISPAQIIQLLDWVYHQTDLYPLFVDSLAISGTDGTLKNRMAQFPGIVKAKTGTMGGITALAGYLCLAEKKPLIFSILLNGFVKPQCDSNRVTINYKHDVEDALCVQAIEFEKES